MVATSIELDRIIMEFVSLLRDGMRVEAIIFFGSYVNGTPHDWSDIDLAVISPDFEGLTMPQRQRLISRLARQRDRRISPIGYPSSEYHRPGPHSFLREIMTTDKVVYEDPAIHSAN